jgi:hypothetical protein
MIDVGTASHEGWKQQALQDGERFSLSDARAHAWKVAPSISDVPSLILP